MAKNRSGHRPGGGIASRVNVQPKIRTGAGNRGVSVGATGQLGQKQGDHTTALGGGRTSYRGEGPIHQGHNRLADLLGSSRRTGEGNQTLYRISPFRTGHSLGKRDQVRDSWLRCAGDRAAVTGMPGGLLEASRWAAAPAGGART